jgi:hypothetical protein
MMMAIFFFCLSVAVEKPCVFDWSRQAIMQALYLLQLRHGASKKSKCLLNPRKLFDLR